MFTGIIEALGEVLAVEHGRDGARLRLRLPREFTGMAVGQSLAVDGVCLTVAAVEGEAVDFDVVAETLQRTTLGRLSPGVVVNLERPLAAGARLGGHFVLGHVDGVAVVTRVAAQDEGRWMEVTLPAGLSPYVAEKGAVAFDGVSLTVAVADGNRCAVALIPHTLTTTTLGCKQPGDHVNVEVDILAKYLSRQLEAWGWVAAPGQPEESEEQR
jgi:riboflavin synthase